MFLLILYSAYFSSAHRTNLHSTMFLLIQIRVKLISLILTNLHSTMFLLIRFECKVFSGEKLFTFHNVSINTEYGKYCEQPIQLFTFHNVSINTATNRSKKFTSKLNLHSTMFLLILRVSGLEPDLSAPFTFHNVSINTVIQYYSQLYVRYLHSTMFLLIQISNDRRGIHSL